MQQKLITSGTSKIYVYYNYDQIFMVHRNIRECIWNKPINKKERRKAVMLYQQTDESLKCQLE